MIRILCTLTFVLMAGAMVAGCADDPYPGRQRPVYSYENVDGDRNSLANNTVSTNVRQRQIHTVILIGSLGVTRDDVGGELGGS